MIGGQISSASKKHVGNQFPNHAECRGAKRNASVATADPSQLVRCGPLHDTLRILRARAHSRCGENLQLANDQPLKKEHCQERDDADCCQHAERCVSSGRRHKDDVWHDDD